MTKKATSAPASKETPINEVVVAQEFAAANQLAVIDRERQQRLADLAIKLGYKGSLGGEALMDGARAAKRRMGMAIMEFGAYLLLLKEGCEHGQFEQVLTELEMVPSTARNYMAVTRRLAKRPTSDVLDGLGYGKAAELLGLDDDQIDELAEAGATGELALDDVARMSVKELRAAVRKERAVKERLKTVNDELNTELATKKHIKKATPDQVLVELQKEATGIAHDAMGCVRGQLRQALTALKNHGDEDLSVFMAGLVGQVQADLTALRNEFNLPDVSSAKDQELAAQVVQWAPKKAVATGK